MRLALGASTVLVLLASWAAPAAFWTDLPDTVPIHFGISGAPDAWASRSAIWSMPAVSLVLIAGLTWLSHLSSAAKKLVAWLRLELAMLFFLVTWSQLQVARGKADALGAWLLPVALVAVFLTLAIGLGQMKRAEIESSL